MRNFHSVLNYNRNMNKNIIVGERIKYLRKENALSQIALAEKISSNQKQVSKWETGKIEPNIDMLKKLADYFEVSVDYLIGRTDF